MTVENPVIKRQRNSSVELLRIVAMVDIVVFHFLGRTFNLYVVNNEQLGQPDLLGELLTYHVGSFGVPCFMFISGYFGIRWRRDRFVDMVGQAVFYTAVSIIGMKLLYGEFNYKWLCFMNEWWFLEAYAIVYLLSPGLNHIVETFSSRKLLLTIAVLWFMLFGSTVHQSAFTGTSCLIAIYFTARYMRIHLSDKIKRHGLGLFLAFFVFQLGLTALSYAIGHLGLKPFIMGYSNPLNTLCVGFLVIAAERVHFTSRLVNWLAASTLSVYLLSESDFGKQFFAPLFPVDFQPLWFVGSSLLVFVIIAPIDKLRILIFNKTILHAK